MKTELRTAVRFGHGHAAPAKLNQANVEDLDEKGYLKKLRENNAAYKDMVYEISETAVEYHSKGRKSDAAISMTEFWAQDNYRLEHYLRTGSYP